MFHVTHSLLLVCTTVSASWVCDCLCSTGNIGQEDSDFTALGPLWNADAWTKSHIERKTSQLTSTPKHGFI